MMRLTTITFSITIRASQQAVFNYVSDWEKQSDWIKFTTVHKLSNVTDEDVNLLAVTRLGPIRLLDTMVVTDWQPFERIVVEHTGRLILGKGIFSVKRLTSNSCEFTWQEITPVPFGQVGAIALAMIKPILRIPFNLSLKKLKSNIESASACVTGKE